MTGNCCCCLEVIFASILKCKGSECCKAQGLLRGCGIRWVASVAKKSCSVATAGYSYDFAIVSTALTCLNHACIVPFLPFCALSDKTQVIAALWYAACRKTFPKLSVAFSFLPFFFFPKFASSVILCTDSSFPTLSFSFHTRNFALFAFLS